MEWKGNIERNQSWGAGIPTEEDLWDITEPMRADTIRQIMNGDGLSYGLGCYSVLWAESSLATARLPNLKVSEIKLRKQAKLKNRQLDQPMVALPPYSRAPYRKKAPWLNTESPEPTIKDVGINNYNAAILVYTKLGWGPKEARYKVKKLMSLAARIKQFGMKPSEDE